MAALPALNFTVPAGFRFTHKTAPPLAFIGAAVLFLPLFVFLKAMRPETGESRGSIDPRDEKTKRSSKTGGLRPNTSVFFAAIAGLVPAQVVDPQTAQRIAEILAGLVP